MNVTKNPLFSSVTDKNNPYIDTVKFTQTDNEAYQKIQLMILLEFFNNIFATYTYVYKNKEGEYFNFYKDILKDVERYPQNFNHTRQEVEKAFQFTYESAKKLALSYRQNHTLDKDLLKYTIITFNDNYYETVHNMVINKIYFVDGIIRVAKCFEQFVK